MTSDIKNSAFSIERGCENLNTICHDSTWSRDHVFYEELCCNTNLCNDESTKVSAGHQLQYLGMPLLALTATIFHFLK